MGKCLILTEEFGRFGVQIHLSGSVGNDGATGAQS
jgi:hypothetical protein